MLQEWNKILKSDQKRYYRLMQKEKKHFQGSIFSRL